MGSQISAISKTHALNIGSISFFFVSELTKIKKLNLSNMSNEFNASREKVYELLKSYSAREFTVYPLFPVLTFQLINELVTLNAMLLSLKSIGYQSHVDIVKRSVSEACAAALMFSPFIGDDASLSELVTKNRNSAAMDYFRIYGALEE